METGTQSTVTRAGDLTHSQLSSAGVLDPDRVVLVVACGDGVKIVPLSAAREIVVGRGEASDVRLSDPSLSRAHARFRCDGARVTVTDLGSRNGTLVRRQAVREAVLHAGDVAVLGCVTVSVQLVPSARLLLAESAKLVPGAGRRERPKAPAVVRASRAMLDLERVIERAARSGLPVLVLGATGTGKELVARELHQRSPRCKGPFKAVNCAVITESLLESLLFGHKKGAFTGADSDRPGVFEQARGGTIFLDEIGELSAAAQAALLRVVEDKRISPIGSAREIEVDVRIVAATHRDLLAMTQTGAFRLDLLHRLNTLTLELPPLCERRDEIPVLARHFLEGVAAPGSGPYRIEADAMECLVNYSWPGNIRELRNVIERAVALSERDSIGRTELPLHVTGAATAAASSVVEDALASADDARSLRSEVREHEAMLIRAALRHTQGNRRDAAALLNVPLRTFERRLARLGIRGSDPFDQD